MSESTLEVVGLIADNEAQAKLSGLKSSNDELKKKSTGSPKKHRYRSVSQLLLLDFFSMISVKDSLPPLNIFLAFPRPETPLPWKTIFVLACCLVSEAVTSNVVFPFVGFMVRNQVLVVVAVFNNLSNCISI
jgi:hypothetical protein